jgi:hypothetical protein
MLRVHVSLPDGSDEIAKMKKSRRMVVHRDTAEGYRRFAPIALGLTIMQVIANDFGPEKVTDKHDKPFEIESNQLKHGPWCGSYFSASYLGRATNP